MDYKSVFTNLCLELRQNRSWVKGLGKNLFTHSIPFTHSLTAVPFVRGHRSVFTRTPRNTGVYTRHPTFVTARVACWHGLTLPAKLSKNGMRVYTLSDRRSKKIACIHGLRSEGVRLTVVVFLSCFSFASKYSLPSGAVYVLFLFANLWDDGSSQNQGLGNERRKGGGPFACNRQWQRHN